jgi:hypothetical protein
MHNAGAPQVGKNLGNRISLAPIYFTTSPVLTDCTHYLEDPGSMKMAFGMFSAESS